MKDFELGNLDHIGITVTNIDASILWYQKVLGLKKVQLEKWGNSPIFLVSGKTGIALFPAESDNQEKPQETPNISIDHFAFNVSKENFGKAKLHYESLSLEYTFKDHFYFHSLYTKDLDGHVVELTTLVVDKNEVYNRKIK